MNGLKRPSVALCKNVSIVKEQKRQEAEVS